MRTWQSLQTSSSISPPFCAGHLPLWGFLFSYACFLPYTPGSAAECATIFVSSSIIIVVFLTKLFECYSLVPHYYTPTHLHSLLQHPLHLSFESLLKPSSRLIYLSFHVWFFPPPKTFHSTSPVPMHSDVLPALLLSTPVLLTYHSNIMRFRF